MELEQAVEKFVKYPTQLSRGAGQLSKSWNCSIEDIYEARKIVRSLQRQIKDEPRCIITKPRYSSLDNAKNILIIGDTHLPYEKEGYLQFCMEQYKLFNCDTVIHIGDLVDSHATSRHPSVPDAYSPGDELNYSIDKLKSWYKAFPNMKVCIGNHDVRANKIASDAKIASKWIKDYNEVLEVPTWEFREYFEIGDTVYIHGTGTTGMTAAYTRALNLGKNVVIGHLHTEASIIHHRLRDAVVFGMIVGCGVDETSYGMNYAKNFPKKSIISCGLVLDGQPILRIMK